MSRTPVSLTSTIQEIIQGIAEERAIDPTISSAVFQAAAEVDGRKTMFDFVITIQEVDEWPKDMLPSTGVPGQPKL